MLQIVCRYDTCGAMLMMDMAHISGLVAAEVGRLHKLNRAVTLAVTHSCDP
jgi:glycine/serine hydroxymethyltransferase